MYELLASPLSHISRFHFYSESSNLLTAVLKYRFYSAGLLSVISCFVIGFGRFCMQRIKINKSHVMEVRKYPFVASGKSYSILQKHCEKLTRVYWVKQFHYRLEQALRLISNLMHKIPIYLHIIHLLKSSTCFEHYPAHLQVYVVIVYIWYRHSVKSELSKVTVL